MPDQAAADKFEVATARKTDCPPCRRIAGVTPEAPAAMAILDEARADLIVARRTPWSRLTNEFPLPALR
jgi:hypothetical protein